jgi:hypothetical protein
MTGKNTMENSKKANGMQKYRLFSRRAALFHVVGGMILDDNISLDFDFHKLIYCL